MATRPCFTTSLLLVFVVTTTLLLVTAEARHYSVNSLSKSHCYIAQDLQSGPAGLGDNHSPVVVGASGIYYMGDSKTGSFDYNLTLQATTSTKINSLFSNLGNGDLWTFGTNTDTWLYEGDINIDTRITHLILLLANKVGNLGTNGDHEVVALSTSLNPYWNDSFPMVFLGMGKFMFTVGVSMAEFAGAFLVNITSSEVTRIHKMAAGQTWKTRPLATESKNWASWGVMERTAEGIKLLAAYANYDVYPYVGGVYRYNLGGSLHSKLYTGFLKDTTTFTVNYWSDDDKRWFTHAESDPEFSDGSPRIPGLMEGEWILSCVADHYNHNSGASTLSCALCSLVSAMWSSFFF